MNRSGSSPFRLLAFRLALPLAALSFASTGMAAPPSVELARLKARFPDFSELRTDSLSPRLAAWIHGGEDLPVWVVDKRRRCEEAVLRRVASPRRRGGAARSGARVQLVLRRCEPMELGADGAARRRCTEDGVGRSWLQADAELHESLIHGRWIPTGGVEGGDPTQTYGVLSEVTADAARYRGTQVRISVWCSRVAVPPSAETKAPASCEACTPSIEDVHVEHGHPVGWRSLLLGSEEGASFCAPRLHRVDLLLFRRINARRPWRIERVHGPFAGIYRTRAACAKDVARFAILPYPRDAE